MKPYEYTYLEHCRYHIIRKKQILDALETMPKGDLVIHKRKNGTPMFYLNIYEDGKRKQKYLSPKRYAELISTLTKKQKDKKSLKVELAFRNQAIKSMLPQAKKILSKSVILPAEAVPFISQNPCECQDLKWLTNRGERVRSKTEKILADLLFEYKIDYKYEKQLKLKYYYKDMYPDFTIVNPLSGKEFYWEHLGLTTPEYLEHWKEKNDAYKNHSITTANYLITTDEDDIENFRNIIEENFTLKRYELFLASG